MKFPLNEQWKVDQSSDKGLNLLSVRNISFENKKYATLAPKNLRIFDENDDASFEAAISFYNDPNTGDIEKMYCIDNDPYNIDLDSHKSISADTNGAQPSGSLDGSGVMFNGDWVVTESNNIHTNDGSTWTDRSIVLTSGVRHPLANFRNRNNLAVGNGNSVKQYNTSYASTVDLSLPAGLEVTGLAYNRNLLAVVCASSPGDGYMFIWDGATTQANYGYPLNSHRAMFVVAYGGTFVTLTGDGEMLYWTGSGLERLAALPCFYNSALLAEIRASNRSVAHDTSVMVEKGRIYMNLELINDSANEEPSTFDPNQPSGVWVFDPEVGLYHRNAPTNAKVVEKDATNTQIDTSTDTITTTATVPATGTPVMVVNRNVSITPVEQAVVYYTIKVSDTEFQLATTYTNALAGTEIDLTAVDAGTYDFSWLPNGDFGMVMGGGNAFGISQTGARGASSSSTSLFTNLVYSTESAGSYTATDNDTVCVSCAYGENRGTIVTQKIFSPDVTTTWQKVLVKSRGIKTDVDKVLMKARISENSDFPIFSNENEHGTWVDSTSFTTTTDLTAVQTALDAGKQYEIEFVYNAGAGYTAHITGLSESSGTWTVTIDETIQNITAGDRTEYVIDNWEKVKTADDADSPDTEDDKNYTEFSFGDMFQDSKWLQLKFELRGNKVALEEYELVFDTHNITT